MLRFVVRRLLVGVLTLLMVSAFTFVMFFGVPADPARTSCGQRCTTQQVEQVRERMGLDRPMHEQYAEYMRGIFVGREIGSGESARECGAPCLGESFLRNREVTEIVGEAIPITASIAIGAWFLQLIFGVGLGSWAALRRGRLADKIAVGIALAGAAMPVFFFAAMLLLIFRYNLGWVPQPDYVSPWIFADIGFMKVPLPFGDVGGWIAGMILPWISIALIGFAFETRMTRSQMLETLDEDFIRTSRAKGLPNRTVYGRHALRASITPIATASGLSLAGLLGGAVITETVFGMRGMGNWMVTAVREGDMPIAMAAVLIAAAFIVVSTMVVDVLYAVIDPRVRLS
ncbi:MAG: ABC transporter permease [Stackebrandtia sp.]